MQRRQPRSGPAESGALTDWSLRVRPGGLNALRSCEATASAQRSLAIPTSGPGGFDGRPSNPGVFPGGFDGQTSTSMITQTMRPNVQGPCADTLRQNAHDGTQEMDTLPVAMRCHDGKRCAMARPDADTAVAADSDNEAAAGSDNETAAGSDDGTAVAAVCEGPDFKEPTAVAASSKIGDDWVDRQTSDLKRAEKGMPDRNGKCMGSNKKRALRELIDLVFKNRERRHGPIAKAFAKAKSNALAKARMRNYRRRSATAAPKPKANARATAKAKVKAKAKPVAQAKPAITLLGFGCASGSAWRDCACAVQNQKGKCLGAMCGPKKKGQLTLKK